MGVLLKQSFWASTFSYLGAILGLVNQIFLYPYFLQPDEVGLFSQIQSFAMLATPVAALGMGATAVKFKPTFEGKAQKAFISYLFLGALLGLAAILTIVTIFSDYIIAFYEENAPMVGEYYEVAMVLICVMTLLSVNEGISRAYMKTIYLNFLKDVLVRSLALILIVCYSFSLVSFDQAISCIVLLYLPSLFLLAFYNYRKGFISLGGKLKNISGHLKEMNRFALYSVLSSAGGIIVLNVDVQMVTALINLEATGIYTRAFYMAVVIELPRRAIAQIAAPLIVNSFKNNDLPAIERLYKSLSINQMIVGMLFCLGIFLNIDSIYSLMHNGEIYAAGTMVVLVVGVSKLIDMTFSVNSEIISMSSHYKYSTYTILLLAVLSIFLNYLLIPVYGIDGAAYASLISMSIFNLTKLVIVWKKYGMMPFSIKNLYVLGIAAVTWVLCSLIPQIPSTILDVLVRSAAITVLFCGLVVLLKVSEDINNYINKLISKFKR